MLSESSGLYFYSAWLQANAAILALFGVFIVYRIQSIKSSIDAISGPLFSTQQHAIITPLQVQRFNSAGLEGKEKMLSSIDISMEPPFKRWIQLVRELQRAKKTVRYPTILLTVGIGVDTFGLLSASWIHDQLPAYEIGILASFAAMHVGFLILVVRQILKLSSQG